MQSNFQQKLIQDRIKWCICLVVEAPTNLKETYKLNFHALASSNNHDLASSKKQWDSECPNPNKTYSLIHMQQLPVPLKLGPLNTSTSHAHAKAVFMFPTSTWASNSFS